MAAAEQLMILDGLSSQLEELQDHLMKSIEANDAYLKKLKKHSNWKNPYLYKTTICAHYSAGKKCKYGDRCWYAHGMLDMRPTDGMMSGQQFPSKESFPSQSLNTSFNGEELLGGLLDKPLAESESFLGEAFHSPYSIQHNQVEEERRRGRCMQDKRWYAAHFDMPTEEPSVDAVQNLTQAFTSYEPFSKSYTMPADLLMSKFYHN